MDINIKKSLTILHKSAEKVSDCVTEKNLDNYLLLVYIMYG